jgi:hypothetical protein
MAVKVSVRMDRTDVVIVTFATLVLSFLLAILLLSLTVWSGQGAASGGEEEAVLQFHSCS